MVLHLLSLRKVYIQTAWSLASRSWHTVESSVQIASTVFGQTMLLPPNFTLGLRRVSTQCHDDNPH